MTPSDTPIDDARQMFMQALRFDFSAGLLVDHAVSANTIEFNLPNCLPAADTPATLTASQVCEAYSVEVFRKTVLSLESVAVPSVNDLEALYSAVPKHWKERISLHFDSVVSDSQFKSMHQGAEPPVNIKEVLASAQKGGDGWRYSLDPKPSTQFLTLATSAIYIAIVEGRPDWAHLRRDLYKPIGYTDRFHFVLGD